MDLFNARCSADNQPSSCRDERSSHQTDQRAAEERSSDDHQRTAGQPDARPAEGTEGQTSGTEFLLQERFLKNTSLCQ